MYLYKENGGWKYTFVCADKKHETGKFTDESAKNALNTAIKDKTPNKEDNQYQLTVEEESVLKKNLQEEESYCNLAFFEDYIPPSMFNFKHYDDE